MKTFRNSLLAYSVLFFSLLILSCKENKPKTNKNVDRLKSKIEECKNTYSDISSLEVLKMLAEEFPKGIAAHQQKRKHA